MENKLGLNIDMSDDCSPVPINEIGIFSSSMIGIIIPALDVPSNFVKKMPSHLTVSLNAFACKSPFCPVVASKVNKTFYLKFSLA